MSNSGRQDRVSLTYDELEVAIKTLGDPTKRAIIRILLQSGNYFNAMANSIGGSKTTLSNALSELRNAGYLEYEWKIEDADKPSNPKKAVKMYALKQPFRDLFSRCLPARE